MENQTIQRTENHTTARIERPQHFRKKSVSFTLKYYTKVEFDRKKRELEKSMGKTLSNDDFLIILMFDRKLVMHKKKKTIEILNASVLSL